MAGKARTNVALAVWLAGASACSGPAAMRVEETPPAERVGATAEPSDGGIVPLPLSASPGSGRFTITPATEIEFTGGNAEVAWIAAHLAELVPVDLAGPRRTRVMPAAKHSASTISLVLDPALDSLGAEGYRLSITPQDVIASAPRPAGLFYAVQTLRQRLPAHVERGSSRGRQALSATAIVDRPRFAWRGAMLDVSRHFLDPADVKRYIDMMALYKLNRLHLHLSDDQGWRIEIKSWPNLTTRGGSSAVGGGAGGFYTQAQYADLVAYAARRFITVVPEIDMPGHTNAALASYAELNCDGRAPALYTGIRVGFSSLCTTSGSTYRFVDDVVREISALTPGPWFHIGGDEVKTLPAPSYAAFVERAQIIVRSHGKQMIGWEEIAEAELHPTTIVQHWLPNSSARNAIRQRSPLILSPANKVYLDMKYSPATSLGQRWAGYITVRTAYEWDPARLLVGASEASILGIEAPLWSETLVTIDDFEYMAFPRLAAIAEVSWSQQDRRDWEDFRLRIVTHASRWSALGINYYKSPEIEWP
ncbi:MAG: family 20 glycosylhydrolase [Gemmatimonadaceae bacterium]